MGMATPMPVLAGVPRDVGVGVGFEANNGVVVGFGFGFDRVDCVVADEEDSVEDAAAAETNV